MPRSIWIAAAVVLLVGCSTVPHSPIVNLEQSRPGNDRVSRTITLDNGLDVWLIHDPKAQKSTAALDVAVGSLEDPWEHLGLAHFLEHMLFLGTEKYPDVEEYKQFLEQNQGYSNAYTAAENTNYHFEVSHGAFEGALDRFAQFFVAPLFTPEFVEREMNAVNSEHQKNLQDDFWRARMVKRSLHRDGHPRQKFSTGTLKTLSNVTREVLTSFYEQYYSANVMKLCILSARPLDEVEGWVRDKFSPIRTTDRAPIIYPGDVFDPAQLPQLIEIKPLSDSLILELSFATPTTHNLYETKPHRLLGALIGDEGPGSLLSQLKKESLALSLSSGARSETYAAYFNVTIGLTKKGRADIDRVIELFFSHCRMLRKRGLQEYYFAEKRTMAELDYYFRPNAEGTDASSRFAAFMQQSPASAAERRLHLIPRYDPRGFNRYLGYLRPDVMRVTLVAPDVKTDREEPAYGTEFSVSRIAKDRLARWRDADIHAALAYPLPNPYIPDNVQLLVDGISTEPVSILEDVPGEFWFQKDAKFLLPKARMSVLLASDLISASPRNRLLTKLFVRCVAESMNEWKYPAIEAGLDVSIADEGSGIRLVVEGYSQRLTDLLQAAAKRVVEGRVDPETFAVLRSEVVRDLGNFDFSQAYTLAFYELGLLGRYPGVHQSLYRPLVESVEQAEVEQFGRRLLSSLAVEGAAYGNLSEESVELAIRGMLATLCDEFLPADRVPEVQTVKIEPGQLFARVISSKSNNNAWIKYVQFGPRDAQTEAVVRAADALLQTGFYAEMRTKQQLGYIVSSSAMTSYERLGLWFLIQSGTHSAVDCATRAETYIEAAVDDLDTVEAETFAGMKAAIVGELRQEDKDMAESVDRLLFEGVNLEGKIGYREQVAKAVEMLTLEEVRGALRQRLVGTGEASLSIYVDAAGAAKSTPMNRTLIETRGQLQAAAERTGQPTGASQRN